MLRDEMMSKLLGLLVSWQQRHCIYCAYGIVLAGLYR